MFDTISNAFQDHLDTAARSVEALTPMIAEASQMLVNSLLNDHRIFCVGTGISMLPAQLIVTSLVHRYDIERTSLPAILIGADAITNSAITADNSLQEIYSKPLRTLGNPDDVLIVCSISGSDGSLVQAVRAAKERQMGVIALCGANGGDISALLAAEDIELRVPAIHAPRINEMHIFVANCLCELIDFNLFNNDDEQ
jgi:D-sedoheptulose 7-phosphate isomerase